MSIDATLKSIQREKRAYTGNCTTRCNKISYNNDTSFEHTVCIACWKCSNDLRSIKYVMRLMHTHTHTHTVDTQSAMQKETEPLKRQHLLFAHIPFTFYVSLNINCTYMHLVRWCDRVCVSVSVLLPLQKNNRN